MSNRKGIKKHSKQKEQGDPGDALEMPDPDGIMNELQADLSRESFRHSNPGLFGVLEKYQDLHGPSERELLAECEWLLDQSQIRALLIECEKGLLRFPDNFRFAYLQSIGFLRLGDTQRARFCLNDAILRAPKDLTLLALYASNCLLAGHAQVGLDVVRENFPRMICRQKQLLLEVLEECLTLGIIAYNELPQAVQISLGNSIVDSGRETT